MDNFCREILIAESNYPRIHQLYDQQSRKRVYIQLVFVQTMYTTNTRIFNNGQQCVKNYKIHIV